MSRLSQYADDLFDDFNDDQIRVIGQPEKPDKPRSPMRWDVLMWIMVLIGIGYLTCLLIKPDLRPDWMKTKVESEETVTHAEETNTKQQEQEIGTAVGTSTPGFVEIRDILINDIPLKLYIPHNADMTLQIGETDMQDPTIIFSAQAADVRADNGAIVGAFVLKGKPLSWGLSKKGFCAVIDGKVTIGVAENSSLFEEATEKGGYFFRQYPLVSDGTLVENEPKGKSIRRAICDRQGEIFMVECLSRESYHDFAQALVDLHVTQAISLVGSSAYGWAVDHEGQFHELGLQSNRSFYRKGKYQISHVVWRRR